VLVHDGVSLKKVYLSPEHGDYSVETDPGMNLEKNKIYDMICPHCGIELIADPDPCPECAAPRVKLCVSGKDGQVLSLDVGAAIICSRSGCKCSNVYPEYVARARDEFLVDARVQT